MRSVWGTRLFHCYGCSPEGILLIWPMQHPPRVLRLSWDQTHLPTHGLTVYKDMTRGSSKRPDFSWSVTCCQAWDLRVTLGRHCTTRWRVQPVGFVQSHIALGDRGGKEPKTRHHMETRCFCRETDPWLDVAVVNLQLEPFFFSEVEVQSPSNVQRVKLPGPLDAVALLAKKWSTSSEDLLMNQRSPDIFFSLPQRTADESRRFARTWDVQKIPKVWQPFRKSASPGFTAGSSITWTKWLKKLGLSYGIFLYISLNQMLDLLAS